VIPWNKLPKKLQKTVLAMVLLWGGTANSGCCIPGPVICDPLPPPSSTPEPGATPQAGTPSGATPVPTPFRHFQSRNVAITSDPSIDGVGITFTVLDATGAPIDDVKVSVYAPGTEHLTWTNSRGTASIRLTETGAFKLVGGGDQENALPLELKEHDVANVEWVQVGAGSGRALPLAEIRSVILRWEDGLAFTAESPWPGADYRWSVSGGALTAADGRVTWQPPAEPGRYLLQVVADWGGAGLAIDALMLTVDKDGGVLLF